MKSSIYLRLSIIVAIIALVTMACQIPFLSTITGEKEQGVPEQLVEPLSDKEEEEALQDGNTPTEVPVVGGIDLGGATLEGVTSTAEGFTAGQILTVAVTNPGNDPVKVTIPCGLVFNPPTGSGEQALMVIQAVVEEIPVGGTAELKPYVVCIESSAHAPGEGSAYQLGVMAEGKLLNLADCFCKEKLNPDMTAFQEILGVQFATWMVADDLKIDELTSNPGEGASGEMMQAFGSMMELFTKPAQQWMDKCGIEQ
jgi:hypothetical protein